MKSAPPKLLQHAVRFVLPPATREHVLGDLQELCVSSASPARYLIDAAVTLPYVIRGQALRNLDIRLIALEAVVLAASFVLGGLRLFRDDLYMAGQSMICAVLFAVAALMLGDIYVEPRDRARFHSLRQAVLAYGSVWLAGTLLPGLVPSLVPMRALAAEAAKPGFALLLVGRILFDNFVGKPAMRRVPASLAEVRQETEAFRRRIRQRNITEYAAAGYALAVCVFRCVTTPHPLMRAGFALAVPGLLWASYELYRRASSRPVPAGLSEAGSVLFYRGELARQRDALHSVHRWYLGPLLPSGLCILAGQSFSGVWSWRVAAVTSGWAALLLLLVWANRHGARMVQRRIEALDTSAGSRSQRPPAGDSEAGSGQLPSYGGQFGTGNSAGG